MSAGASTAARRGRLRPPAPKSAVPRFVPIDASDATSGPHVALVPGEAVAVHALDLPEGLRGAVRERVAWRQVSERLGVPSDRLDIRPFPPGRRNGWTRVTVASREDLEQWRGQAAAGCRALVPDYLALPVAEGVWTIAVEGGRVRARLGPDDAFTAGPPLAAAELTLALAAAKPQAVLRLGEAEPLIDELLSASGLTTFPSEAALAKAGQGKALAWAGGEASLDLGQGATAAADRLRAQLRAWRLPVLLGVLALGLWGAGEVVQMDRAEAAASRTRAATEALVRRHFVPDGPILDTTAQVSRALADRRARAEAGSGEASPLDLFRTAAPALAASGGEVRSIAFRPPATLEVEVRAADFANVDTLLAALSAAGLSARVLQATTEAGAVLARLGLTDD